MLNLKATPLYYQLANLMDASLAQVDVTKFVSTLLTEEVDSAVGKLMMLVELNAIRKIKCSLVASVKQASKKLNGFSF